jgi:DNA repair exonuclease SbcCD ATPase subunit
MCKKFLIAGVAVALGLMVVKKTEVGSHLRAWWRDGKTFVQNSIPIDSEIERLRGDIARLDNVYRTQFHPVAVEATSIDNLKQEIVKIEKRLEEWKSDIDIMTKDVDSNVSYITYGDVKHPRDRVVAELSRRFAAYKTCQAGLKAKQELLAAKEEKYGMAMNTLEEMKNARTEMEAELARLEAEYETVKVAQVKSNFKIDDSELSRLKGSMAELRTRVQVEKKKCELAGQFISPVNPKAEKSVEKRDLVKEINDYFGKTEIKVNTRVSSGQ